MLKRSVSNDNLNTEYACSKRHHDSHYILNRFNSELSSEFKRYYNILLGARYSYETFILIIHEEIYNNKVHKCPRIVLHYLKCKIRT